MEEWLTIYQAAELANYDPDHLRKLVRANKIQARKWGYTWQVSRDSLLEFVKESEKKGEKRGPKKLKLSSN
jgi:excisionase family DNA binding protein